jgi:hypothetical protein
MTWTRSGPRLLQTRKKSNLTNGRELDTIVEAARYHYKALTADISNAKDRVEHIRLTALAQQAHNLLLDLVELQTGIKPTSVEETPLDIPEFKSPYNPDA